MYIGTLGAELFLARTAFVEASDRNGLVSGGTYAIRAMVFPLVLLFFMIPIPAVIYNRITFPLQLFASEVAAHTSWSSSGYRCCAMATSSNLPAKSLALSKRAAASVRCCRSPSCRSVYGYFFDTKRWMRVVLFLATVPIAILANCRGESLSPAL